VCAVDITAFHGGFHGDLNETLFVGEVDEASRELVKTTYECLKQAIDEGRHFHLVYYLCVCMHMH
jgi:methionyl aminopeptidase